MTEDMLRQALDRMPVGYALHKIIIDDEGSPCDYEYVEANRAFEEATGLVAAEIVGKRVTEVIPNIKSDEFDWIRKYSEVALKGQTLDFEQHSSSLNKIFKVNAFSPKVGFFKDLSVMRGKLDIHGTINNKLQRKQVLACEYDELSENNMLNRILKTSATILLRQTSVSIERRKALKKVVLFFDGVDTVEPSTIRWDTLHFRRNNQSYKMLMNICYFVLAGLLLSTEKGEYKMASFLDEQRMSRLYEKFVLEYYRYHHPSLQADASQVAWNIDDDVIDFLPIMQTDITLKHKGKTLIIDTKYYGHTLQAQSQFDSRTVHSNNLYQIFTYVKNKDVGNTGNVAGMLLYAKTDEEITPDSDFKMSGNKISVKTLDLNVAFGDIAEQLDKIAVSFFGADEVSA